MKLELFFTYSPWLIPICLLCGALFATVLYFRSPQFKNPDATLSKWLLLMAAFRFIVVSFLCFLLLAPFLKTRTTEKVKPIIVVLQDESESIKNAMDSIAIRQYQSQINQLVDDLSDDYDVQFNGFGDKLGASPEFNFEEKATNLSEVLDAVSDLYFNKNMGGVILASDGIYNQGNNPVYSIKNSSFPIYTIALGDTSIRKDLRIDAVKYNKVAYFEDRFATEIIVRADNLKGKQTELIVYHNKRNSGRIEKHRQTIEINQDAFLEGFQVILDADESGVQHFIVEVKQIAGEFTTANNRFDFYVDVLDGRKKILLIANAPHPDIAALRQSVMSNNNYELDVAYADNVALKYSDYNLVILHGLPSLTNDISNVLKQLSTLNSSLLYILTSQTDIVKFSEAQNVVSIERNSSGLNDVTPAFNDLFDLYKMEDPLLREFGTFPPVYAPFGDYTVKGNTEVQMFQKIGSINAEYPLLAFNESADRKIGVFAGDGLWRWRMYDFLTNNSHQNFDEWFNQAVQFLSIKTDKRPLRVFPEKNRFSENEPVRFNAQMYNANFEPINEPDIELTIVDQEDKSFEYVFERRNDAYFLDIGFLPVGAYRYSAKTNFAGKNLTAEGTFTVNPIQLESLETRADHQLMFMLAANSGGKMVYPSKMNDIIKDIDNQENIATVLYEKFQTNPIINLKWIFYVLLLFISAEWFLRKFNGGY